MYATTSILEYPVVVGPFVAHNDLQLLKTLIDHSSNLVRLQSNNLAYGGNRHGTWAVLGRQVISQSISQKKEFYFFGRQVAVQRLNQVFS